MRRLSDCVARTLTGRLHSPGGCCKLIRSALDIRGECLPLHFILTRRSAFIPLPVRLQLVWSIPAACLTYG